MDITDLEDALAIFMEEELSAVFRGRLGTASGLRDLAHVRSLCQGRFGAAIARCECGGTN